MNEMLYTLVQNFCIVQVSVLIRVLMRVFARGVVGDEGLNYLAYRTDKWQ